MLESGQLDNDRGSTPVVGVILIVTITIILASVIGVYAVGFTEDVGERPSYSSLELNFQEEPASEPNYDEFRWQIELTHTGGETVDANDIVVHLDHGDQQVTRLCTFIYNPQSPLNGGRDGRYLPSTHRDPALAARAPTKTCCRSPL